MDSSCPTKNLCTPPHSLPSEVCLHGGVFPSVFLTNVSYDSGFTSLPLLWADSDGAVLQYSGTFLGGSRFFASGRYRFWRFQVKYPKSGGTFFGGNTIHRCLFRWFPVFVSWRCRFPRFPIYHKSGGKSPNNLDRPPGRYFQFS